MALAPACGGDPEIVVPPLDGNTGGSAPDASVEGGGAAGASGLGGSAGAAGPSGAGGGEAGADAGPEAAAGASPDDAAPDIEPDMADVTFGYDAPECASGCDGGVCVNGHCCALENACGSNCCTTGEVCSFQQCVIPGITCIDATDCPADHYCEYSLGAPAQKPDGGTPGGCQSGVVPATGKCLPRPPQCAPGVEIVPGEPITCLPACEHKPSGGFSPVLKYHWDKGDIMMAPVVIQLDDDNCDGVVDERDIPEIVFSTFAAGNYNANGTLWAVSVHDDAVFEKWSLNTPANPMHPGRAIAAGNIDGQPGNEVVVCNTNGKMSAISGTGMVLWTDPAGGGCLMPSIGDLDGDGKPEVVDTTRILNGLDGTVKATLNPANSGNIVLSDMDGDSFLDVVSATGIWGGDGVQKAVSTLAGSYIAVGDFDKDGVPEVASINNTTHTLSVWRYDAAEPNHVKVLRTGIDINGTNPNVCPAGSAGATRGGGPPTIADFNADGTPDVAVAGGIGYAVIDGTKLLDPNVAPNETNLWLAATHDCSSAATGSSLFDFEGDGKAEVVYSDEHYLRVYEGTTGNELFRTCNTTGTLFEYPLVADVDADGQADLVVVANSYSGITCPDDASKQKGLRVFSAMGGQWVRTRRVWNQHAYHVTNVEEDGTIPAKELPNWTQPRLNNFRQNVQPIGEFSAPDLIVTVEPPPCNVTPYALIARVRNIGQASVPAGIPVGFYQGNPSQGGTLLGIAATSLALYPAEAEDVKLVIANPSDAITSGASAIYAVVDHGQPQHAWAECRTDNNQSGPGTGKCQGGAH